MLDIIQILKQLDLSVEMVAILLFFILLMVKLFNRIEYFHRYYTNKEFDKIKKLILLKDKISDEDLKMIVQETIEEYTFRKCTNIYTNQSFRKFILENYKKHNIELYHFKRAFHFFQATEIGIEIKISKLDRWGEYFNYLFSFIFAILFFVIIISFILESQVGLYEYFIFLFSVSLCGISSIYILTQNFPLKSALYLKEKLNI